MSIELTAAAAEELRRILNDQGLTGPEVCVRVGAGDQSSRHGFTLDLAQRPEPGDHSFESHGVHVVCPGADLTRLDGFCIDFRDLNGARGFLFVPPKSRPVNRRDGDSKAFPLPEELQVREALREVIDPEVGINIVDLGLIYGVAIDQRNVHVTMTMTTPACPLGEQIKNEVYSRTMERCPGVLRVEVEIVWNPPWNSDRMSEAAKQTLGWSR